MRQLITAAFALALCACAPTSEPGQPAPQAGSAQSACAAQGGVLERVGRAQTLQCVIVYADGGDACRNGSECRSGQCLGPVESAGQSITGQCQETNMAFGCYTRVVNGRAEAAICVD